MPPRDRHGLVLVGLLAAGLVLVARPVPAPLLCSAARPPRLLLAAGALVEGDCFLPRRNTRSVGFHTLIGRLGPNPLQAVAEDQLLFSW